MDRSWIYGRLFSPEYIEGVKHFMSFIKEKFSENSEILCPCSRCLNQKYFCQALVKKHILMNGMDSSYIRWIHHVERVNTEVFEHLVDLHDNSDGAIHGEDDSVDRLEACQKNKVNRGKVLNHQKTGSRSYHVVVENLEDDEYSGSEPDAFDLFKICHFSKRTKGYTPTVQSTITEMAKRLAVPPREGEEPKSKTQVVAEVLDQNNKKNTFLRNVGMQTPQPRPTTQDVAAQLEREKMEKAELLSVVNNQRKQLEEAEHARIRMEEMSKTCADLEAKVNLWLGANRPS